MPDARWAHANDQDAHAHTTPRSHADPSPPHQATTRRRAAVSTTENAPSLLGLLFRMKAQALWNRLRQVVQDAPVRVSAAVILVGLIWLGLYGLFDAVFQQLARTPLEATVAIPLVFNFFFVAMLALLTFSNAIIAYGALFGRHESAYLLSLPLTPLDVVTLKFLESLLLSSWSLILLGLPLMMAMAEQSDQPSFYVIFIAFFLTFIPIPGALGLLVAWAAAMYFPRRAARLTAVVAGIGLAVLTIWTFRNLSIGDTATEAWLRSFLARMGFVESALLPNHWVATGIDHAMHQQWSESLLYLGVTLANALFLSWIFVRLVARHLDHALDRASSGRAGGRRPASPASGGLAGLAFFYLPLPLRLVAAKDLRTFLRDPLQWSQLIILFGLLALYLTNMPTLRLEFSASGWMLIIPFLNLCAVSLILATFTCRFVFPLVSLEGQKLWLIGVLPMPRGHILLAKFAFSMTVTLLVAIGAMCLATVMLDLEPVWAVIHISVTIAVCFGLCGFAVGLGARLPMFNQSNAARIANGIGGTTNLLASVALVAIVLSGVGYATWRSREEFGHQMPDSFSLLICAASILTGIIAGAIALHVGARHFSRVEV